MSAAELLHWWNLVFLVPGAVGTMLGLVVMLGVGDHDAEHEVPHSHDLDHGPGLHQAGHDHVPVDHGVHHDPQHHGAEHGWVGAVLSLLGFGRIPFGVSLISLMLFFALFGLGANALLGALLPYVLPVSAVAALAGSALVTRLVGRLFARFAPKVESHAGTFSGLAGSTGTIVSLLSPTEGYGQVHDRFGNLQEVRCQSIRGEALRKDMPILVVEARVADHLVLVVENDLETRIRWARPFDSTGESSSSPSPPPQPRPSAPPPRQGSRPPSSPGAPQPPSSPRDPPAEAPLPAKPVKES